MSQKKAVAFTYHVAVCKLVDNHRVTERANLSMVNSFMTIMGYFDRNQ